eukprot:sb/3473606/
MSLSTHFEFYYVSLFERLHILIELSFILSRSLPLSLSLSLSPSLSLSLSLSPLSLYLSLSTGAGGDNCTDMSDRMMCVDQLDHMDHSVSNNTPDIYSTQNSSERATMEEILNHDNILEYFSTHFLLEKPELELKPGTDRIRKYWSLIG